MRYIENNNELYLLVDIDDFLVRSSDKLQETLDKKTNFKTAVLRMLEQLNRNCRYFMDQVQLECEFAKSEGEKPNLRRFHIFDTMKFNSKDEWYTKPIKACTYYLKAASDLLNQFLEERDTFLEIDNLPKGEMKAFNYEREMQTILYFKKLIDDNKDAFHLINSFCLRKAEDLINSARINNAVNNTTLTIPNYGALVSMDTNDIIKSNSLLNSNSVEYKEYVLYQKPLDNIRNCIILEDRLYDIVTNGEVFFKPSGAIVDYQSIHSLDNVNWDAVRLVEELMHSGMFKGVYLSTHHNGKREERAKIILMQKILPEADGFLGQRFHDTEHDAVRRGRSSKIVGAILVLKVKPEQLVLMDDSKPNCGDCKDRNGTEILYKPKTDAEIIKGQLEDTGYNRILSFNDDVYGFIAEAYVKPKIKRK